MVQAEIHGKVPAEIRGDEDVLTSTVFGLLEFVPLDLVLLPWMATARNLAGRPPPLEMAYSFSGVAFRYWPRFPELGDRTELDLLLSLLRPDGSADLVALEVKYRSGPSGWPVARELDGSVRGQLGREWAIVAHLPAGDAPGAPSMVARRLLLYVTPEPSKPRVAMRAMVDEVTQKNGAAGFEDSLFWLCWLDLFLEVEKVLSGPLGEPDRTVLERLAAYLRSRRLESFSSIRPPETQRVSWSYA